MRTYPLTKNIGFTLTNSGAKLLSVRGINPRDMNYFVSGTGVTGDLLEVADDVNDWKVGDEVLVYNQSDFVNAEKKFIKAKTRTAAGVCTFQLSATSGGAESALTGTYTTASRVGKISGPKTAKRFWLRATSSTTDEPGKLYFKTSTNDSGIVATSSDFYYNVGEVAYDSDEDFAYMSFLTDDTGTLTIDIRIAGDDDYSGSAVV